MTNNEPVAVTVPKSLEPMFLSAEEVAINYFANKSFEASRGMIEISGERYILMRSASLASDLFGRLRKEMELLGRGDDEIDAMLYGLARSIGRSDAENFCHQAKIEDRVAKLSLGPLLFSFMGWAHVNIFNDSMLATSENFFLHYEHEHSFESDSWIHDMRHTERPICTLNAGYAAGWCEESFGVRLAAVEIACRACGDPRDEFIMAHPQRIGEMVVSFCASNPNHCHHSIGDVIPRYITSLVTGIPPTR